MIVNDYALADRTMLLYSVRIVNKVVHVFFTFLAFLLPLKDDDGYMKGDYERRH